MFDLNDQRYLEAAEGWLELGLPLEASAELAKITPTLQDHPAVLELRWHIFAKEKKWEACIAVANASIRLQPERSDGWVHRSFALHEMKRTQEALDQLRPVADRFPKVWLIPYNLACYASRLHQFDEAQKWLNRALAVDKKSAKHAALDDEDLQPLWDKLGGTMWKRE